MTNSELWLRIRAVLDVALDLPRKDRLAFVASECKDYTLRRQVFSILAAYDDDPPLPLDVSTLGHLPAAEGGAAPGDRIGPYRLLEKRGEGGMGAVYLATRDDESFDKKVAIKLLKRGWSGQAEFRRFRVERQILADLEHPNIAKLLDGGSTPAGQPYFVMEFVEGVPIDEYCERRGLDLDERLGLFLEVCSAVQFAHQNLIVHRDLKPGNILVGADGRPRLLDFGIAKILSPDLFAEPIEETVAGITPMTPQYASPEQIRGDAVGTPSDVYSLGVILYRLLTGLPPYHFDSRDMAAVVDAVCHQEVVPPSARLKQAASRQQRARGARIAGDLDAIVLQALTKDPARRYATAEHLADDLQRHLSKEPVRARGNAVGYRARRFLERHFLGLSSAALVFLILVGALVVLLDQRRDLIAERNRAFSEKNRAVTVSDWLVDLFTLPDPGRTFGATVTARALLDRSSATIRTRLATEPELLATLLSTLGETYENLGQLEQANGLATAAIANLRRVGASDGQLAEALRRLAVIQRLQGDPLAARKTALAALLHAEKEFGPEGELYLRCLTQLAHVEHQLGHLDVAAGFFDSALVDAERIQNQGALAELLEFRAELLVARGDNDEAYAAFERALKIQRGLLDPAHPEIAKLEVKMASVLVHTEPLRAEAELRLKLAQQQKLYGGVHPFLVGTLGNLGLALFNQNRLDESEAYFGQALAMTHELFGERHGEMSALLINLGNIAVRRQDYESADRNFREAIEIQRQESGEPNATVALYTHYLAQLELTRGHLAESRRLTEEAMETTQATIGTENLQTLFMLTNLAEILRREGHPREGRDRLLQAVALGRKASGWSTQLRAALFYLGSVEYFLGEHAAARDHLEEVARTQGYDPSFGPKSASYLAAIENRLGRPREAESWARKALEDFAESGELGIWVRSTRLDLAAALRTQGRFAEAEAELGRYLEAALAAGVNQDRIAQTRREIAELAALQTKPQEGRDP